MGSLGQLAVSEHWEKSLCVEGAGRGEGRDGFRFKCLRNFFGKYLFLGLVSVWESKGFGRQFDIQ